MILDFLGCYFIRKPVFLICFKFIFLKFVFTLTLEYNSFDIYPNNLLIKKKTYAKIYTPYLRHLAEIKGERGEKNLASVSYFWDIPADTAEAINQGNRLYLGYLDMDEVCERWILTRWTQFKLDRHVLYMLNRLDTTCRCQVEQRQNVD